MLPPAGLLQFRNLDMKILAFDTALDACSAAVCENGRVIAQQYQVLSKGHAEALVPMIQSVLAKAAMQFGDVDLLAVTVGPGTFTGIRVGLSAARGIALTTGLRIAGVTTLAAIAEGARSSGAVVEGRAIVVFHDAHRGELFCQVFPSDANISSPAPELIAVADAVSVIPIGPAVITGSGAPQVREQILNQRSDVQFPEVPQDPGAVHVARVGARLMKLGDIGPLPPKPLYLRAPDARLPGTQVR